MTTVESLARPAPGAGGEAAMTGAVAMARQLKAYGVELVFGVCGHTNIALLVALEQVGIDFVIARHEQAAAHAADGYARVTGKPGVLLVHVGPGMMNAVTEQMPEPLVFTDSAANKVKQLIEEEGNPDLKLRVFVTGGGCSGFQYGFTFDEATNEDDTTLQKAGVTLLIDPMSLQYLTGAEIDYQENLEGAQFVIKNPNATSTCGCGSSFTA